MPTELMDHEEMETLDISDDGSDLAEDQDTGADDGGEQEEEDRGDVFIDPEEEESDEPGDKPGGDQQAGEDEGQASGDDGKTSEEDERGSTGGVPFGRLNEVARVKSAATAIADGIVDGEIDPQVIKDLGGANAVAKAIANKEITLEELKTYDGSQGEGGKGTAATEEKAPESSSWDLDQKYVEYQELVDAGETKAAAGLLRQINREERARERAEEVARTQQVSLNEYVGQIMQDYPTLADVRSKDHEEVMVWANHFQATGKMTRQVALGKAIDRVFGKDEKKDDKEAAAVAGEKETPQQRTVRERKEEAVKRGAKASQQQPPPMGLGATPQGPAKIDIKKMSDAEFERLSEEDKARERGDYL